MDECTVVFFTPTRQICGRSSAALLFYDKTNEYCVNLLLRLQKTSF